MVTHKGHSIIKFTKNQTTCSSINYFFRKGILISKTYLSWWRSKYPSKRSNLLMYKLLDFGELNN